MTDKTLVGVIDDRFWQPLSEIDYYRWIKRCGILKSLKADEELKIRILLDLLHQFFIGKPLAGLDDQRTKGHAEWFSGCSKTPAELCYVVILKLIPED